MTSTLACQAIAVVPGADSNGILSLLSAGLQIEPDGDETRRLAQRAGKAPIELGDRDGVFALIRHRCRTAYERGEALL